MYAYTARWMSAQPSTWKPGIYLTVSTDDLQKRLKPQVDILNDDHWKFVWTNGLLMAETFIDTSDIRGSYENTTGILHN